MSLATSHGQLPWAATVFFVADDTYKLYFISSETSRHSLTIASNPNVAATINKDHDDWLTICGLQIDGQVSKCPYDKQEWILSLYLNKFIKIKALYNNPQSAQEKLIADRIVKSRFYQLEPQTIRLIDNRMGFGTKVEINLSD